MNAVAEKMFYAVICNWSFANPANRSRCGQFQRKSGWFTHPTLQSFFNLEQVHFFRENYAQKSAKITLLLQIEYRPWQIRRDRKCSISCNNTLLSDRDRRQTQSKWKGYQISIRSTYSTRNDKGFSPSSSIVTLICSESTLCAPSTQISLAFRIEWKSHFHNSAAEKTAILCPERV